MKINSLYIASFGGLKNKTVDFSNGFNVIYGENEKGKSTLMAFIKMMFYGSDRGGNALSKNLRKKYTPWDGSQMAGRIDFTHGGKDYRLEREFKGSNSTDKVTLIDLSLGDRKTVASDVGSEIFGLSAAAFERSVFIGQLGFPESDDSASGELNSKLSNVTSSGDENVSFEEVNSRLEKAKFALMSKSGKAGEYDKNLKLLSDIKREIEASNLAAVEFENKRDSAKNIEKQIVVLQKRAEEIKQKIGAEQDARNAEKLKEYLSLKSKLDQLSTELKLSDGSLADEMYVRKLQFCSSKEASFQEKLQNKTGEIERLKRNIELILNPPCDATTETAEQLEAGVKTAENRILELKTEVANTEKLLASTGEKTAKAPLWPLAFLVLGIGLSATALGLGVSKYLPLLIVGAAVTVLYIVLAVALSSKAKAKTKQAEKTALELQNKLQGLNSEIGNITETLFAKKVKLEAIKTALNANKDALEEQQNALKEAEEEYLILEQDLKKETLNLKNLLSLYQTNLLSFSDILNELTTKNSALKEIKSNLNFIAKDLGNISFDEAKEKLELLNQKDIDLSADFDSLKNEYDRIIEEISQSRAEIATLAAEGKVLAEKCANSEALKKNAIELSKILKSQKEFCDTLDIAKEVLLESFAELRQSYGSNLENKAAEIFASLTGNKYTNMSISKSLEINVTKADVFGEKEVDYLSSGTADQAYLSLRLALSSLLCENGEALPILLDDALTQYDDGRLALALEFLKSYSDNSQILLFTCHSDIGKKAEALSAQIINL